MTQGKVHIEVMPDGWCQTGEHMAEMVNRLPGVLRRMLGRGATLPTTIFTDRGPGFYHSSTGTICPEYIAALHAHGFTPPAQAARRRPLSITPLVQEAWPWPRAGSTAIHGERRLC